MEEQTLEESTAQQCIFCHIIAGGVPSRKVYEDDKVVAVMDINPATPGHLLLLTKEHYAIMPQIPELTIAHLGVVAKALSQALLRAVNAQGTNIFVANGFTAGQRAQHFMLHIIPRTENDGLALGKLPERAMAEDQTALLQKAFSGKKIETPKKEEPAQKAGEKPARKPAKKPAKKPAGKNEGGASLDDIAKTILGQ